MYVSVCVPVSLCTAAGTCGDECVCTGYQKSMLGIFSQMLSTFLFKTMSLKFLELTDSVNLGSKLRGLAIATSLAWDYKHVLPGIPGFLHRLWGSNSGPQDCIASTLLIESEYIKILIESHP